MKFVKFSKIKNLVIVGLVFAAVYQTGTLWLGNYAGHNFFYTFFSSENGGRNKKDAAAAVMDAQKIVVGYGNKTFNPIFPGIIESNNILSKTNGFISSMLQNGKYVGTEEMVLDKYISQKCVIYDFAFDVSATQYFLGMGASTGDELNEIGSINQIISVPSAGKTNISYLYIVDTDAGKTNIYEAELVDESEKLYTAIEQLEGENVNSLKYISTKQSGFNIFKENTFVPQWTQSSHEYAAVNKISSLSHLGGSVELALENGTANFFDNYYTKTLTESGNGIYMISDDNIVVKYYPEGIIEYYNYQGTSDKNEQTLSTAYYACKAFLSMDKTLNTKLFLADVQLKSDGLVFYFDYCVNDVPIFLSEDIKTKMAIGHGVEVVVENNTVKKYKRYAYDFVLSSQEDKRVNVDFLGAMNQAIATAGDGGAVTEIEDIILGYYVDDSAEALLKWFTYVDDGICAVDAVNNGAVEGETKDEE